jgi:uncharacterized membrane protein
MAAFSPLEAAFEGFRIVGKRPLAVLSWGLLFLLMYLLLAILIAALALPHMREFANLPRAGEAPDPEAAMRVMSLVWGTIVPIEFAMFGAILMITSAITASAYRIVLRPDEGAPFNVGFGLAELQQLVVRMGVSMLVFVAISLIMIPAALLMAVANLAPPAARGLLDLAIVTIAAATAIGVAVRFSLAGPATLAEGQLRIFESWTLTRGRAWSLFGAYLLSWVMALVVLVIVIVICVAGATSLHLAPTAQAAAMQPVNPGVIIAAALAGIILVCFMYGLLCAILLGPPAHAYAKIAGAGSEGDG